MIHRLYQTTDTGQPGAFDAYPTWVQARLYGAALTQQHLEGLAVWTAIGPVVALASWRLVGAIAAWFIVGVVAGVPVVFIAQRSGRQHEIVIAALPDVVDATSRALRSGASFSQAVSESLRHAPPAITHELGMVLAAIQVGQPSERALQQWVDRMTQPEVEMVAGTFALAHRFETGASQALDGVGQSLRDRAALAAEVKALTAQASASLRTMVMLPAGFLLLDALTGRRTLDYLMTERLGRACLVLGLALNLIGWWWMNVSTRRRLLA